MPIVDENRLKGNYGASVVMARLSGECLVRPVAADTDVGVDLYCETVIEGQPFLHFWLQIKAGGQCEQDATGNTAKCRFSAAQLAYWARQPVPVFAALVPTDWPTQGEPCVYVIDLTSQILFGVVSGSGASLTLSSDHIWRAGDQKSIREFLAETVPVATARLQISKGVVADIPTLTPQYVRTRPLVPVLQFKESILAQLRVTAATSILFMFAPGTKVIDKSPGFRRLLANIVEQFGDDQHWENFMSRALSSHADENYEGALIMYKKARECIQADGIVRDNAMWKEKVREIQVLEKKAHCKEKIVETG